MAVVDETTTVAGDADRFHVPLYSVPEAAHYLGVPTSTFSTWAYGYVRRPAGRPEVTGAPVVTAIRSGGAGAATIPFVGLAEGQRVFTDVIDDYLHRVEFAGDGYVELIHLPHYRTAEVVADPRRGFGQPIFAHGGAKLEDVLGAFQAGESLDALAQEYGVPVAELEDTLRVASRLAA